MTCADYLRALTTPGGAASDDHAAACPRCAEALADARAVRAARAACALGRPPDLGPILRRASSHRRRRLAWVASLAAAGVGAVAMAPVSEATIDEQVIRIALGGAGVSVHPSPEREARWRGGERNRASDEVAAALGSIRDVLRRTVPQYVLAAVEATEVEVRCLGCSAADADRLAAAIKSRSPAVAVGRAQERRRSAGRVALARRLHRAFAARAPCACVTCIEQVSLADGAVPVRDLVSRPEVLAWRLVDEHGQTVSSDPESGGPGPGPAWTAAPTRSMQAGGATSAPLLGGPDAPVRVLVFADLAAVRYRATARRLNALVADYAGSVSLELRHRPAPDGMSIALGRAGVAAQEQGRFWPFHGLLIAADPVRSRVEIVERAVAAGLERDAVEAAIDAPTDPAELRRDRADAEAFAVVEVPTVFINGRRVSSSADATTLRRAVDEEMAFAAAAPRTIDAPEALARALLLQGLFDGDRQPCRALSALRRAVSVAPPESLVRASARNALAMLGGAP